MAMAMAVEHVSVRLCPRCPGPMAAVSRYEMLQGRVCVRPDEHLGHAFNVFVDAGVRGVVRAVDSRRRKYQFNNGEDVLSAGR